MRADRTIATLLFLAYLSALAVSTAHLAGWYALTLGDLPQALAWGLAVSLELVAFLLSLAANLLPGRSPWAAQGAYLALTLVWLGNYRAMLRAEASLPLWEVLAQSLFVPVGTLVVAKAIGDLVRSGEKPGSGEKQAQGEDELLEALPATLVELSRRTGLPTAQLARFLAEERRRGRVEFDGEVWRRT